MITRQIMRYPFRPAPHKKADGSEGPQTYGWTLQEQQYAWVDPELRDLICMCLYENPGDRPSPLAILRAINKWKDSGHHDPTELVEWWKDVRGPRPVAHHEPKAPNANFNATQQGVIDQMGVLALYSVGQPRPRNQPPAVIQPAQPAVGWRAPNQLQLQGPVQRTQGGANPRQVPPTRPQQPERPANPHVPAKVATTRNKNKRPVNIQVQSKKRPSAAIESGEAMDIEREEAAYRFSVDPGNFAVPIVPSAQVQNNAQPGGPSGKSIMSIRRATQHPARRIRFEDPLKPSKKFKVHKNLLSPKIQKMVRRPGAKKSEALYALVRGVTSHMPATIQNLMSRVTEVEARLDIGAVPIYAYLK
jgi:hypothetical protein